MSRERPSIATPACTPPLARAPSAGPRLPTWPRLLAFLAVLFFGLGFTYSAISPVGESPDAPAHLGYVDYVLDQGLLPPLVAATAHDDYEAHQPPLDYLLSAFLYRALGGDAGDWRFTPRSDFRFDQPGSRNVDLALRPGAGRRLLWLRLIRIVLWGGGTLVACVLLIERTVGRSSLAVAALFPVLLAPQLLFILSSVSNDAAVACLSSWSLLGLVAVLRTDRGGYQDLAAGLITGLALFVKSSAIALSVPLAGAVIVLFWRRQRSRIGWLVLGFALPLAGWSALNLARFSTIWPPPPTGIGPARLERLLELRWIGSLFVSYWGKLGWLNLPLPATAYLLFLPATLLVACGIWAAAADLRRSPANLPVLLLPPTNLALLVGYMVEVDWQPQGRLLYPSLAAIGILAAIGAERISRSLSGHSRTVLGWSLVGLAVFAAAFGAWWISLHYPS